jgi:long-subunit acyl-CoA synthetase (AMP-forming)
MAAKANNFEHIAADLTAAGAPFELAGGLRATYGETLRKAAALSRTLAALVENPKGARIAIVMANRPEWMIAFIAITALGATAVAVNSRGTSAEIAAALADTDTRLAIADVERARLIHADAFAGPLLVVRNGAAKLEFDARWQCFEAALTGWEFVSLRPAALTPDTAALVLFTADTAGRPRGALLTQRNAVAGSPTVEIKIVDAADCVVQVATTGEIWLRGAVLMHGDASAAIMQDGWLNTGHCGCLDAQGFLHVIDSTQDVAVDDGETIS